jgi:HD-GYP domain-containing protein (c-di-GMP phosphodiesterase class II)/DNA-binding CsgD family transcriptional regulator
MTTPIRLAPFLGALSLTTDLGGGFAAGAARRTAVIASRVASACGCPSSEIRDAYYAGMLRFLGCTAYAYEASVLVGGDDLAFLQAFADVDLASKPAMLARSVTRLAAGRGALARLRAVLRFVLDPGGAEKVSTAHCELGRQLAKDLGMPDAVVLALRDMYERWDGRGVPRGLRGAEVGTVTRVLHTAHVLEVYSCEHGAARALDEIQRRRSAHFDPRVCAAVMRAGGELLQGLDGGAADQVFLDAEPQPWRPLPATAGLLQIARTFAAYADVKSPYTLGHSFEVARTAVAAATRLGVDAASQRDLEIAALLHDLGRVGVSNELWDAPRRFQAVELERVRLHGVYTERVLAQLPALAPYAELAAAAHERLDGSGYHRRPRAADLSVEAQILAAADAWVGMRSIRPHRPALSDDAARQILAEAGRAGSFSERVVAAVTGAGDAWREPHDAPCGLTEREVAVLLQVARGLSNKEIGRTLGISPRTVQTHLEHCFQKTGARSRSAAAIFAARHGLLERG